jgi:polyisoprenoid-binding protein YceI
MVKILKIGLFLILVLPLMGQSSRRAIDTENSIVEWVGAKVTGEHSGIIRLSEGYLEYDGEKILGGKFVIDMNSLENQDILRDDRKRNLEKHLKSDDFFDVSNHPTAEFEISSAVVAHKVNSEQTYRFYGDLTIKGITHVIDFESDVKFTDQGARASGKMIINRAQYNIRYKSGSFYEDLGDRLIYDEFSISFNVVTQ